MQGRPRSVAFVAERPVLFGMRQMYDSLTNEVRSIHVFRKTDDPKDWLDSLD